MDASSLRSVLAAALPGVEFGLGASTDRPTVVVPRDGLLEAARVLRDLPDLRFQVLTDVTAVDRWPSEPRFEVVYHLLSPERPSAIRLVVWLRGDDPHVGTLSALWPSANWLEREVWDLFGVVFEGHPDLRRLMMPTDWEGYPLRKDYPVQIAMKPKVYEPLQVSEEEFHAKILADRWFRGSHRDRGTAGRKPDAE